jgi:membrane protease YdiL (CAAX protease family)
VQNIYNPAITEDTLRRYEAERYRTSLRRTSNGLGFMLIAFIGMNLLLSIMIVIMSLTVREMGMSSEDSIIDLLSNGMVSSLTFFVVGLFYCLFAKRSLAEILPFEKIGAAKLAKLCVIGIAFNLFSNSAVDLVSGAFSLVGIENKGGTIDVGSTPDSLLMILTVAILPAFVEEFAFRGVVMGTLRPYSEGAAILISSATFALMHGNFVQMPFTFCCGLVFAYIDIKCNSLLPSVIVHFLNNGLSVAADLLIAHGIMSELVVNLLYGVIFIVTGVLAFIFIKGFTKDKEMFILDKGSDIIPFKKKITTICSSPTMIIFTVIMVLLSIMTLFGVS